MTWLDGQMIPINQWYWLSYDPRTNTWSHRIYAVTSYTTFCQA